jgi:undecaprenyl pyrophosphate phosphatase UppP
MSELSILSLVSIPKDDPVAFTFFTGYMAMFAASVFFFFERGTVDAKWKTSLLVSGLITGIAAVHYYYMRDYYAETGTNQLHVEVDLCFGADVGYWLHW